MNKLIEWNDIKNTMTALTDEEKRKIDMISDIVSKIIEKQQELGLSQRDLEKLTGIKQETICRIEKMKKYAPDRYSDKNYGSTWVTVVCRLMELFKKRTA